MPNVEQVLNQPLSGEEIKKIIVQKLEQSLNADTRLADYVAVPSFQFRLDVAIVLTGAVMPEVSQTVQGGRGSVTDDPERPATVVTHHVEQKPMSPNEARVESGIGVPVLTRDDKGRQVEKRVKYTPEQARRAKGE